MSLHTPHHKYIATIEGKNIQEGSFRDNNLNREGVSMSTAVLNKPTVNQTVPVVPVEAPIATLGKGQPHLGGTPALFFLLDEFAKTVAEEAWHMALMRAQLLENRVILGDKEQFTFQIYSHVYKRLLKENLR